jgi:hypothetical protein
MLTSPEQECCAQIAQRIDRMRALLNGRSLASNMAPAEWYQFLSELRRIQGNSYNDLSFIATLLAKQYLERVFGVSFDATAKPQGAPGIDIDISTSDGERIIGEIKTTVPYLISDFGAQQATNFKKDFAKLNSEGASYKLLFVTEPSAFYVLQKPKYCSLIPGVQIILLPSGETHLAN